MMKLRLSFLLLFLGFLAQGCSHSKASLRLDDTVSADDLQKQLLDIGLGADFVKNATVSISPEISDKIVFLNIGSMRLDSVVQTTGVKRYRFAKSDISSNKKFMSKYSQSLQKAKKIYGVSPEYITALIWTETKHGRVTGTYPIYDVFATLLSLKLPHAKEKLVQAYKDRYPNLPEDQVEAWVEQRVAYKTEWAAGEMQAIEKMFQGNGVAARGLIGSYAGAFGLPQFLPSSYLKWSASAQKGNADLFVAEDAIHSAANYLKVHGWSDSKLDSRKKALFAYNRSDDYVNGILALAQKLKSNVRPDQSRQLASATQVSSTKNKKKFRLKDIHLITEAHAEEAVKSDKPSP